MPPRSRPTFVAIIACLFGALLFNHPAYSYSVLTHEALVDAMWDVRLKPLLLMRYPNATPEALKKATGLLMGAPLSRTWVITPTAANSSAI
jgi:hypothetical protein